MNDTLSIENRNAIIWGGIYKADPAVDTLPGHVHYDPDHNQRHGLWIPAYKPEENEVWMIDTYQVEMPEKEPDESWYDRILRKFTEDAKVDGSLFIFNARNLYWFDSPVRLDDRTFQMFHLYADLREWKPIHKSEATKYNRDDLLEDVSLCSNSDLSHITLVKQGAIPDSWNVVEEATKYFLDGVKMPEFANEYRFGHFQEALNSAAETHYNKTRTGAALRLQVLLKKIYEEHKEELDEISKDLKCYHDFAEEDAVMKHVADITPVKLETVQDLPRFLQENCYCPGEVYSFDGFGYVIFEESFLAYPLGSCYNDGSRKMLIKEGIDCECFYVPNQKGMGDGQMLLVMREHDNPEQVFDLLRMDATANNLDQILKMIRGENTGKFDTYIH